MRIFGWQNATTGAKKRRKKTWLIHEASAKSIEIQSKLIQAGHAWIWVSDVLQFYVFQFGYGVFSSLVFVFGFEIFEKRVIA